MSLDLYHLWAQMGMFAKGIVFVMAIMSIYSLTIVITKLVQLKRSERETRKFAPQFSRAIQRRTSTRPSRWPRRTRRATSPGCWARRWPK
jgi:biopolymer transport protein ExbB/TolQ